MLKVFEVIFLKNRNGNQHSETNEHLFIFKKYFFNDCVWMYNLSQF